MPKTTASLVISGDVVMIELMIFYILTKIKENLQYSNICRKKTRIPQTGNACRNYTSSTN